MQEILPEQPIKPVATRKRWLLFVIFPAMLIVYLVLTTVVGQNAPITSALDVIFAIATNIVQFAWIRFDAEQRDYRLHRLFPFAVVIFGTLALIYYLLRSRGPLQGVISIGWTLLYAVGGIIVSVIVAIVIVLVLILAGVVRSGALA